MLYFTQFENYKDFRERFGFRTDVEGNYLYNNHGQKQRKNRIPYLYYKLYVQYYKQRGYSLSVAINKAIKCNNPKEVLSSLLYELNMAFSWIITEDSVILNNSKSCKYKIIEDGITPDNNVYNIYCRDDYDRKVSIKIGKFLQEFFNSYINRQKLYSFPDLLVYLLQDHTLCMFLIEEISELWKKQRMKENNMSLNVDYNFEEIYNPNCRDNDNFDFRSCMDEKPNWQFYQNNPHIFRAVSLIDPEKRIYARALLINCIDSENKEHVLLERIYFNKRIYKQRLFDLIKEAKICDLYKDLEASCRDSRAINYIASDERFNKTLHINLILEDNDITSYQDTFKFYYPAVHAAYNKAIAESYYDLATTNLYYDSAREPNLQF